MIANMFSIKREGVLFWIVHKLGGKKKAFIFLIRVRKEWECTELGSDVMNNVVSPLSFPAGMGRLWKVLRLFWDFNKHSRKLEVFILTVSRWSVLTFISKLIFQLETSFQKRQNAVSHGDDWSWLWVMSSWIISARKVAWLLPNKYLLCKK